MGQRDAPNSFAVLETLVASVRCKPGWSFRLEDEDGALRLVITIEGTDSYAPANAFRVAHNFPVPNATYNLASWRRWIFEMCRRLENHELGEWFVCNGWRPFAPLHGPGEDPYTVHEFRAEADALTTQDGSMREAAATAAMGAPLTYPATVAREDGLWVAQLVDLKEAQTLSETVTGALLKAEHLLDLALVGRLKRGEEIPQPSPPRYSVNHYKIKVRQSTADWIAARMSRQADAEGRS